MGNGFMKRNINSRFTGWANLTCKPLAKALVTGPVHVQGIICQQGLGPRAGGKGIGRIEDRSLLCASDVARRAAVGGQPMADRRTASGRGSQQGHLRAAPTPGPYLPCHRGLVLRQRNGIPVVQPATRCRVISAVGENHETGFRQVAPSPCAFSHRRGLSSKTVEGNRSSSAEIPFRDRAEGFSNLAHPAPRYMAVAEDCDRSAGLGAGQGGWRVADRSRRDTGRPADMPARDFLPKGRGKHCQQPGSDQSGRLSITQCIYPASRRSRDCAWGQHRSRRRRNFRTAIDGGIK